MSVTIQPFTQSSKISPSYIASAHLKVRRDQETEDNNIFSDIYDSQADLKDLESYYITKGGNFFVAIDNDTGNLAGFVGLRNDGHGQASLKRLAVTKDYRRQGIAHALVKELVDWARAEGFAKIQLQTGIREHARPVYEDLGFLIVGTVERKNKPHDWLMELDLTKRGADERT